MEAKTNLKSRLPSRHVTEGPERAPHIGVASCSNEAAPCGTPRAFCTITVTDGIAMGHDGTGHDGTMAAASEAIGLALLYSAGAPAPYEFRDRFCMAAGEQVLDLVKLNLRLRMIATRKSLQNAAAVEAASGGSTNAALHLPAIAHECRMAFDLFDDADVFKRTPYIADLKPGGRFVAKDLFEAGRVPLLTKTLLDNGFLHGECMTVTGSSMAENLPRVAWNSDQDVGRPADRPLAATGGVVGLRGNLAPDGAIVKVAGMQEAAVGGPISLPRDGDTISVNAERGSLDVQLSDAELEKRRVAWQPRGSAFGSGYLWKYAQQVGAARHGAVTHPGGSTEKTCYADI